MQRRHLRAAGFLASFRAKLSAIEYGCLNPAKGMAWVEFWAVSETKGNRADGVRRHFAEVSTDGQCVRGA